MANVKFGGGNGLLIPNVLKIHLLQREHRGDDKLQIKNIGAGNLAFALPVRYIKGGEVKQLPYSFSLNGEPVGDRPLIIPPGATLILDVEADGALISSAPVEFGKPRPILDSELPAETASANVIGGKY